MRKLLFLLLFLIFLNILSYNYLKTTINNQKEYTFHINEQSFIIQKKDLIIEDTNDFIFDEYFSILSLSKPSYNYFFDDNNINITLNNKNYTYPYSIKKKEIIEVEVEKINTQHVPVYVPQPINNTTNYSHVSNTPYFTVNNSYYSFSQGTDLSHIINAIRNAVDSPQEITLDFSLLNPNESGRYPVYFYTDSNSAEITVEIIWLRV